MVYRQRRAAAWLVVVCIVNCLFASIASAGIVSTKQEIAIGEGVAKEIEKRYPLVDDPALQERIDRIGRSIVAVTDRRQTLPYSFKVLDVDDVNAMAAPGGFIYVFRGLTDLMPTDDELAGILGHEIGHVVERHSMAQMEKSLGMMVLLGALFGERGFLLQTVALDAIAAGYSRSDEREADRLGYELSVKAGYNQYGMLMGLMKLQALNPQQKSDLFSDHPEAAARIKLMQRYLAENKVSPTAALAKDGSSAQVVDGKWSLPPFKIAVGNTGPLYRAYLAAGRLHCVKKRAEYSADRYILDSDGVNLSIYYEEQLVLTVTPQDAEAEGVSLEALVDRYLAALRAWRR